MNFTKKILTLLLIGLFCSLPNQAQLVDVNKNFEGFKELFLSKYWELNPVSASYQGLHEYDDKLPLPTAEFNQERVKTYEMLLRLLSKNTIEELSDVNKTDYYLIENLLQADIWYIQEYDGYSWNPTYYNLAGTFNKVLKGDQPNANKIIAIYNKLLQVPDYYTVARENLTKPTIEHTELAIKQIKGGLSIFEDKIPELIDKKNWKKIEGFTQSDFDNAYKKAVKSIKNFNVWLEKEVLEPLEISPEKARSYRLGNKLYTKKFKYDLVTDYTPDEIFRIGTQEKKNIHKKMKALTTQLWPKYFGYEQKDPTLEQVRELIDKIAENHVKRDEFVDYIRNQIPELEAFVKEKDLMYIDPAKPLEVRETPEYMRGVAGASISAPGPYEAERPTYYNVTPLDDYTDEQADSYLREYNHYILQILNIHEAIPGHYTQLVYANKAPSKIKSLFGNGTMIEGWACYVERMMLEEGYGDNAPEMWLMYYKWNLREICNALIDIATHTKGWQRDQVMDLLVKEAFQEETEAEGKWRRLTLSQVQLCSYYTGLTEIYNLREEQKKELGEFFDLKLFHTKFLSYGSAPVKYIREMMMKE